MSDCGGQRRTLSECAGKLSNCNGPPRTPTDGPAVSKTVCGLWKPECLSRVRLLLCGVGVGCYR